MPMFDDSVNDEFVGENDNEREELPTFAQATVVVAPHRRLHVDSSRMQTVPRLR